MTASPIMAFTFDATAIRVIELNDGPWFVAADVADVLGYRDAEKMSRLLDEDEKGTHNVGTLGGPQSMTVVSESGLYNAAFRSRRPEGIRLRKWVTSDVLPSIRRDGSYGRRTAALSIDAVIRGMLKLYDALRAEPDGDARLSLHHALDRLLTEAGINTPPLNAFDDVACLAQRQHAAILDLFWERYDWLAEQAGAPINLHRDPDLIAISLPDYECRCALAGLPVPGTTELRAALRSDPRFIGNKPVNGRDGKTVNCWVFERLP